MTQSPTARGSAPSPTASRMRYWREQRNLSAAALADRVPDPAITRSTLTNIENGRRADLSAAQTMQVASALGIPVLALLVDTTKPWSIVDQPGLAEPYASMTVAEYISETLMLADDYADVLAGTEVALVGQLRLVESQIGRAAALDALGNADARDEARDEAAAVLKGTEMVLDQSVAEARRAGVVESMKDKLPRPIRERLEEARLTLHAEMETLDRIDSRMRGRG